jgi:hypothetical protein
MTITITKDSGNRIEIFSELEFIVHATAQAIEDTADAIEAEASAQAPLGNTGELKAHPVDRDEQRGSFGRPGEFLQPGESIETRALSFVSAGQSPRFTVRGKGGRFVRATPFEHSALGTGFFEEGTLEKIVLTIPEEPAHARWVHDGTGIYGPNNHPIIPNSGKIMVWENEDGNTIKAKSVKGQKANPYLERAFVIIERTFYPARVEALRAEIRAI